MKENLKKWFDEEWVRITTSGDIAGPCGTSKNKKNPDRCLPKAKAQSLSKAERAATASKKKKAGSKGKTVVSNTKRAKVTTEDVKKIILEVLLEKKDDRCTKIAKQKYDTWPSAYASAAVTRCRQGKIWKKKTNENRLRQAKWPRPLSTDTYFLTRQAFKLTDPVIKKEVFKILKNIEGRKDKITKEILIKPRELAYLRNYLDPNIKVKEIEPQYDAEANTPTDGNWPKRLKANPKILKRLVDSYDYPESIRRKLHSILTSIENNSNMVTRDELIYLQNKMNRKLDTR